MEETVKKYIYSLLTSSPLTITVQQLVKDYRNTIGESIPYHKLGYNSLEHFLNSVPDTVVLRGSGPGAQVLPVTVSHDKSAHVNELVTHQKINRKPFSAPRPRNSPNYGPPMMKRKILYPPPSTQSKPRNPSFGAPINKSCDIPEPKQEKPLSKTPPPPVSNRSISNTATTSITNSANTSSSKIANNLVELNKKHATPTNEPEVVKLTNESIRVPYIDNKSNLNKNSSRPYKNERLQLPIEKSEKMVPLSIRNNLKVLISRYPKGIWCAEVPSTYRKMFNQDLKYQELGFRNLIDLCSSLSTVFHYCRPSTEDFKLYDRSRPLPECAEKKFTIASYSPPKELENENADNALPSIDWLDVLSFLPEGVFKPGNEIPRTFVPENTKPNDTFNIRAGEVFDLSKFWVYIDDGKLDTLMDDLQTFYQYNAAKYQMPENLIREGIYCVQMIFQEYHRALIVDVMPELEGTIRVVYIDYGTTAKVSTKGLCYLHNDFAQLPAQAIRCRLSNILPPEEGMPWTREASVFFRQCITNKDLVMRIARINWQDNYLEIHLADVSNKSKIFYVNEYLVEQGHAIFSDQEQRKSISIQSSIVKYIHLFPTFLELEFGVAPSAQDMEVFHDLNIPINFTYPQYFKFDFDFEIKNIKSIQEMFEISCPQKKRDKKMHYFNHSLFAPQPFDLSLFGNIQAEVKESMSGNSIIEYSEECIGPSEEEITNSVSSTSDEEILKCVTALQKDCILTKDIVKDLEDLYNIGSNNQKSLWPSSNEYCMDSFIFNNLDEVSEYRDISGTSQTLDDSEGNSEEFVHPLSEMTFDSSSVCSPESIIENWSFKDPVDEEAQIEFDEVTTSYFKDIETEIEEVEDELYISLRDTADDDPTQNKPESTNPFYQDICDESENSSALQVVNPNNPFLNFLEENSEESDESSNATVYGTYTEEINVKKTWSTHDSGTTDELNVLETVSCISGSSDSCRVNSLHTAQSCDDNDEVQSFRSVPNNYRYPISSGFVPQQFPPHPYPQEYPYQNNWSGNYGNPYQYPQYPGYNYQPHQFNPHYMHNQYRPYMHNQYGQYHCGHPQSYYPPPLPIRTTRPAICPPPGFESRSNVHMGSFGPPRNIPVPVLPGSSIQAQTIMRSTTVNLHTAGDQDFYEVYNQQLQSKLKLQEDN